MSSRAVEEFVCTRVKGIHDEGVQGFSQSFLTLTSNGRVCRSYEPRRYLNSPFQPCITQPCEDAAGSIYSVFQKYADRSRISTASW